MNLHLLNLNLLTALDVLLEEQSVTRAAKHMGVTQPAASRALAQCRILLEDPLLVRVGQRMQATPRAEALRAPLRGALKQLERALEMPEGFDPGQAQRVFHVMSADLAAAMLLPRLQAELLAAGPGLDLQVHPLDIQTAPAALESGEMDLLLAFPLDRPGLRAMPLSRDEFAVAVRTEHPDPPVDLDHYLALDHLLISPLGRPGSQVDRALAERGLQRRVRVQVPHFLAAPHLLAHSQLCLTAPRGLLQQLSKQTPLRLFPCPVTLPPFRLAAVFHERFAQEPALKWLRQATRRASAPLA